jgi:hypothetical protein
LAYVFKAYFQESLGSVQDAQGGCQGSAEVDALVILGDLESQVRAAMRFDEDVYELLPKNAKDVASTETEEERKTRKEFYRKTGGKIQVSIPERKRERGPRTSYSH